MIAQLPSPKVQNRTIPVQPKYISSNHFKRYEEKIATTMMEPEEFLQHWDCTYEQIARVCKCSRNTVASWFCEGKTGKRPSENQKMWLGAAHTYLLLTRPNQQ